MRGDVFRKRKHNSCNDLSQVKILNGSLTVLYSQARHLLYFFESPRIGTVTFFAARYSSLRKSAVGTGSLESAFQGQKCVIAATKKSKLFSWLKL